MATMDDVVRGMQEQIHNLMLSRDELVHDRAHAHARINYLEGAVKKLEASGGKSYEDNKLNYAASNGMKPKDSWEGSTDSKRSFNEYRCEMGNCLKPLHRDVEALLKEALGSADDTVSVEFLASWSGDTTAAIDRTIWGQLYSTTVGEARAIVMAAGEGNGLQAWKDLHMQFLPNTGQDQVASVEALSNPTPASNEGELQIRLTEWLRKLAEHGARFQPVSPDLKMVGLKRLLPAGMYTSRFAGEKYDNFEQFLSRVKNIASDRSTTILRGVQPVKKAKAQPTGDPMDIGVVTETAAEQVANVLADEELSEEDKMIHIYQVMGQKGGWQSRFGYKSQGKGSGKQGNYDNNSTWSNVNNGNWYGIHGWGKGQANYQEQQFKGGFKGGVKGNPKGSSKGGPKGGGKDRVCYACGGMGHIARNCPSSKTGGKGMNEVTDDQHQHVHMNTRDQRIDSEDDWGDAAVFEVSCERECPATKFQLNSRKSACVYENWKRASKPRVTLGNRFQALADNEIGLIDYGEHQEETADIAEVTQGKIEQGANGGHWVKITGTIDSGCVDHVVPKDYLQDVELEPSPMSKAGKSYRSATSEGIPNLGQKNVKVKTKEGQKKKMTLQVANVTKPLFSTTRLNDSGNDVNLTATDPHILHKETGERTALRRVGRACLLDLWVWVDGKKQVRAKRGVAKSSSSSMEVDSVFGRQR